MAVRGIRKIGGYLVLSLLPLVAAAQESNTPDYPKDYFRNPLDIPIFLAGNFGECRSGHFHSGLDIKTQSKENMVVYAAADGYISRIKTEKGGFGHAIYITHPNGYSTLYAHLNAFVPRLQQYLRQQQYEKKRWDLDLSFSPDMFPVTKGQQIAWSGNTGGSSAPHLHFEVRDSKTQHPLNPQLFGLEVTDKLPPVIAEVVFYSGNVYDRNLVSYTVVKKDGIYRPVKSGNSNFSINVDTVDIPAGLTGIGVNADDYMNGSDNTITFLTAELKVDDATLALVTMDNIGYDISRYIHAYADYYARQVYRKWIQCLFKIPGNKLHIFSKLNENNGRIPLNDSLPHKVEIVLTDNSGNVSRSAFYVRPVASAIPAKDAACTPFYAGKTNEYTTPNISFTLDERQLYDDICFSGQATPDATSISDRFRIHFPYIPLHHYFDLMIKPGKTIPLDMRSKVVLMYSDGKDDDGKAAKPSEQGWYKASVRNFGTYWLVTDTEPPVINSMQKNGANLAKAKQIAFTVKDNLTSVDSYSGYLDNKWICFEQHGNNFFYEFDEHCPRGKHTLVFKAEDENGNEAKYVLTFNR